MPGDIVCATASTCNTSPPATRFAMRSTRSCRVDHRNFRRRQSRWPWSRRPRAIRKRWATWRSEHASSWKIHLQGQHRSGQRPDHPSARHGRTPPADHRPPTMRCASSTCRLMSASRRSATARYPQRVEGGRQVHSPDGRQRSVRSRAHPVGSRMSRARATSFP